jgi:hypothetical protein
MMPYGSYQLYQAERTKSAAEIRRADKQLGEMSQTLTLTWQHVSRATAELLALLGRRRPRIRAHHATAIDAPGPGAERAACRGARPCLSEPAPAHDAAQGSPWPGTVS